MDLDDILTSALDEVTLDEEDITKTDSDVKQALSSAAATTAKTQDENAQIAASAEPPPGEDADLANLMKMLGSGGGDLDKMLEDMFKDSDFNDIMKNLGGEGGDDELNNLMKMLTSAKEGGEPDPKLMEDLASKLESSIGSDQMNKMLENMMKQVMSKEVMYEPVKAITEEYPKLLSKKGISPEDRGRYELQYTAYRALRVTFEQEAENTEKIVQIMQDLEKYGQPPDEVMKLLSPEGGAIPPPNPNSCPTQ